MIVDSLETASRYGTTMEIRMIDRLTRDPVAERAALVAGLRARPAAIPPKYFYDPLGSALYGAICELPEYYPTRTERAIFDANRVDIANTIGTGAQFVDLGAGDGSKAEAWLPYIVPARYLAVDIAGDVIERTLARLAGRFAGVEMAGVVTDFTAAPDLSIDLDESPAAFFYPGSSIGNFTPEEAIEFMRRIQAACEPRPGSGLLIGVDTKKDKARLDAAYDDALGVTALFNRNVLNHVNRVLGSDFDPAAFAHRAFYAEAQGRIEMHLEAKSAQAVLLDGETRVFAKGERIHTESSYKYAPDEFETLIACAGFATVRRWRDPRGDFAVFWAA
jgi:dimethylhistidine N-methyltransferase